MADKIKKSYKFSKKFYDDALTQSKWWSRLYFRLLWGGTNDNEIARRVLDWIPDVFDGKLLDVPPTTISANSTPTAPCSTSAPQKGDIGSFYYLCGNETNCIYIGPGVVAGRMPQE